MEKLLDSERWFLIELLVDLRIPYDEFHASGERIDNETTRQEFRESLADYPDERLINWLPALNAESLHRLPYLSLHEACSLLVGYPAELLNLPSLAVRIPFPVDERLVALDKAKGNYDELLEIAQRAVKVGLLSEEPSPPEIYHWAAQYPELLSEDSQNKVKEYTAQPTETSGEKPISARTEKTLLKMIYALAINELNWTPDKNDSAASKLSRRIQSLSDGGLNIAVGERTIRGKLKAARDVVRDDD